MKLFDVEGRQFAIKKNGDLITIYSADDGNWCEDMTFSSSYLGELVHLVSLAQRKGL